MECLLLWTLERELLVVGEGDGDGDGEGPFESGAAAMVELPWSAVGIVETWFVSAKRTRLFPISVLELGNGGLLLLPLGKEGWLSFLEAVGNLRWPPGGV